MGNGRFLGLTGRYCDYGRSPFAVLPIPYDAAASFHAGSRHGPAAIIEVSPHLEENDEELNFECCRAGIATLEPLGPNVESAAAMHEDIYRAARQIVRDGKFVIALGGDHSITSGLVRAVMSRHKKLSVLQIDAHLDQRDTFDGGKYSHASVMRRTVELGASVVSVGIRCMAREEHDFVKRASLPVFTARTCHTDPEWIDGVLDSLGETVYITLDIDGFDPALAPGTGTPEPGGLDWYQVIDLLRRVIEQKNVVAADIVEVMPLPGQCVTEFLAARAAYKIMTYVQHARRARSKSRF